MLQRAISADLGAAERKQVFASDRAALALWPDPTQELRGGAVLSAASLPATFDAEKVEIETSHAVTYAPGGCARVAAAVVPFLESLKTG